MQWLTAAKNLVGAFFRGMFANVPQLIVVSSIVLYLLIKYVPALSFASIILWVFPSLVAGGFFAWITKSVLYREVLRDELSSIIYDEKHLDLRQDRLRLLKNALFANGLPKTIADFATENMLKRLFAADKPYFYRGVKRVHKFRWVNESDGTVQVVTKHHTTLLNAHPEKSFKLKGKVRIEGPKLKNYIPTLSELEVLDCNGKAVVSKSPGFANVDGGPLYQYEVEIVPGREFKVDLVWTSAQDIDKDNTIVYEAPVFVESLTTEVVYDPREMNIVFQELGSPMGGYTAGDPTADPDDKSRVRCKHSCQGLVLPGAGYILTIQRVPRAPAAD